jgi:hypothetical protein
MPKKPEERRREDAPRTDLPPVREPYYEGYFGTDEEEGVVREHESGDEGRDEGADGDVSDGSDVDRDASEGSAGGDREIT